MPKSPTDEELMDVIKRNPRLDNLITYYIQCDEAAELLVAIEERENDR